MAAASVELHPAEQIVALSQGQMDREAVMWLAKGHTKQPKFHTGWDQGCVCITAGAVVRPASG